MGVLHYNTRDFVMDDRLLAHLQVVIALKLRRSENFFLAWVNRPDAGSERYVIWIDNGIPIFCEYESAEIPAINRDWIDRLAASAATNYGLQVTPEGDIEPFPAVRETAASGT
ncbi:hypothetical protein GCM10022286_16920 [Gryllotalpicola daejeonensis]|uniref:DUF7882 domain-containing protein n=1 Tax=Gryllotalpicola daejeonensis TaxID=993087 RepID=A0ABP7ZJS7_9MICO